MMRCSICKTEFDKGVYECPKCAVNYVRPPENTKKGWIVAVVAVIAVIALIVPSKEKEVAVAEVSPEKQREKFNYDLKATGRYLAKQVIKNAALDPESVKFLDLTSEVLYPNDSSYVCKWHLTATNAYGGRIQGYGVAGVKFTGGDMGKSENWVVKHVRID